MFHIVLDTNIIRSENLFKGITTEILGHLVTQNKAVVYMSIVSQREFITAMELERDQLLNGFKKLRRNLFTEVNMAAVDCIKSSVEALKTSTTSDIGHIFSNWIKTLKVQTLDIADDHGKRVIKSYFEGDAPFKEVKRREDFPDAFIYESVVDLSKKVMQLYFISNDATFNNSFRSTPNIKVFRKLTDFLKGEETKDLVASFTIKREMPRIREFLKCNEELLYKRFRERIEDELRGFPINVNPEYSFGGEGWIDAIEDIDGLEWDIGESEYIMENMISIQFRAKAKATVALAVIPTYAPDNRGCIGYDDDEFPISGSGVLKLILKNQDPLDFTSNFEPRKQIVDIEFKMEDWDLC